MIYFVYNRPLTTLFIGYMLHKYLSFKYPKQYQNMQVFCAYYAIYYFSKFQLLYFKMKPHIEKKLEPILELPWIQFIVNHFTENQQGEDQGFERGNYFELIKNGCVIQKTSSLIDAKLLDNYDFVIYSEKDENKNIINKRILLDMPKKVEDIVIENTDYKFILTEVNICDKDFKVDLFNKEKYNYFIADNVINSHFILYYLKKYYPDVFNESTISDIEEYNLKIMDDCVCVHELDFHTSIHLGKNQYQIVKENNNKSSESNDQVDSNINPIVTNESIEPNKLAVLDDYFSQQFDNKRVSDYINFACNMENDNEDMNDLPDLILINTEEDNSDTSQNTHSEKDGEKDEKEFTDNFS